MITEAWEFGMLNCWGWTNGDNNVTPFVIFDGGVFSLSVAILCCNWGGREDKMRERLCVLGFCFCLLKF